jgi:ADP-ribosyl-[dinitrogen reductase] hydrolase
MSSRRTRTSESHPIRVDFVDQETLGLHGQLGMTICPGVKDPGRWDRDLGTDLDQLRQRHHADVLVTLLKREEFERYGVPDLLERAGEVALEVIHFPITDVSTPPKAQSEEYATFVQRIVGHLRDGKVVVIHCRGGLSRTGTVAASVLVALGHTADEAIGIVRRTRGRRAVETREQEEYVRRFADECRARSTPGKKNVRRVEPTQIERYRGCLLGLAIGDAVGTTLEFKPPGTFRPIEDMVGGGPFGLEAGQWTDDTSMALCLAESLIERRGFDPADQLERYVRWYREGHMSSMGVCFDIGNATRQALERFEKTGEPYSGSRDPKRAGNGSIMRLAPVPLFYARALTYLYDDLGPVEAIERSGESSRTTHGAQNAVDACRYLGALIAGAVNGFEKEQLLSERFSPVGSEYWEKKPLAEEVDEVAAGSFKHKRPPEIKGSGYVVRSLEAALWAFHNSDSFEEGTLLAVNLGDDADTTGAVYGQLAGAYYGERAIPEPWRLKLAHRLLIEYFAERLFRLGETLDWG